jgi:outer membrane protein assembly factor BamB
MKIDDLIFVGLNGYALALNRMTGEEVWRNNQLNSGFTTLLLDGDRLIVSTNGYLYCLNPLNGEMIWENALSGLGTGITDLTSTRGQISQTTLRHQASQQQTANQQ